MLLGIYLNDHLLGATVGRELAHRAATSNRQSSHGPFLTGLAEEIDEDRDSLIRIMGALEVRVDPVKVAAGWGAEKLARLKFNGRLTGYSPLSRVVELEGLTLGVRGKLAGWRTLQQLRPRLSALEPFDLDTLEQRAERQLEQLEAHRLEAAAEAFPDG
jgi:hypothetical protein